MNGVLDPGLNRSRSSSSIDSSLFHWILLRLFAQCVPSLVISKFNFFFPARFTVLLTQSFGHRKAVERPTSLLSFFLLSRVKLIQKAKLSRLGCLSRWWPTVKDNKCWDKCYKLLLLTARLTPILLTPPLSRKQCWNPCMAVGIGQRTLTVCVLRFCCVRMETS